MNKIKFSHHYPKIWAQKTAKLLAVEVFKTKDLFGEHPLLWFYDTAFCKNYKCGEWFVSGVCWGKCQKGDYGNYDVPAGKLLQLVFLGENRIPFCTLRRWTGKKEKYYRDLIRQEFEIDIQEWPK